MTQSPHSLSFQHIAPDLRLFCGEESLDGLFRELQRSGCRRAAVVCGRAVNRTDAMDLLRATMGPLLAGVCETAQTNSPLPAVEETAGMLNDLQADAVVAIGGGSAVVTARAASILLGEQQPAQGLCTRRLPDGRFESPRLAAPKLPQFAVPTTPSTAFAKAGSAVHDAATGERLALFDPKTRARALFLHPAFLRTPPDELVRSAVLNTLSTAIEALQSPTCDPLAEAVLVQALRLIAQNLGRLSANEVASREYLALAGVLCGRGTEQGGGGLASVLAHAIGHRCHAANGIVNAIVLPHTMRFNGSATLSRAGRVEEALSVAGHGSEARRAFSAGAAEAVEQLLADQPIPRRLRDIGIDRDELDGIAQAAMSDWFISRSPRRITGAEDLRGILEAAW